MAFWESDDIVKPIAKLPFPITLSLICELTHIATCDTYTTEKFVKICDEVCDTYSNAKCEVPNNASLRCLVTLKVCSDTLCIVKCVMF